MAGEFIFENQILGGQHGLGIPDWWQLQYFGYVGVDPYAFIRRAMADDLSEVPNGIESQCFLHPASTPKLDGQL